MPRHFATDRSFRHRGLARTLGVLVVIASLAVGPSLQAQSSPVCEFAIATIAATELELSSAKKRYRDCAKGGGNSCKVEFARVRDLQHLLKLARDYLDRYCLR